MRARTTLVLLVLFVIAAGYVLLVERKKPTEEEVQQKEKTLLTVEPKDVRSVRIENGGSLIAAERRDTTNWVLTSPVEDKAENTMFESLLSQIKSLQAERVFAPEDSLSAFGLAPPAVRLRIETKKGAHTIEVGDKSPTGDGYFARVDGSPRVAVIQSYVVDGQMKKPVGEFRDKRLADFPLERARRVLLETPENGRIEMTRESGEGPWKIVAPASFDADPTAVNTLVNRFRFLRAKDFVEGAAPDGYGFAEPSVRLTVTLDDGTSRALTLGKTDGEDVYAQVSGRSTIYKVPASTRTDLVKNVMDLRDKRVMDFEPNDAVSLTLVKGDTTLAAEKDSTGAWHFKGDSKKLVTWRLEDPIRNLSILRAVAFPEREVPEARAGLVRPRLVATVTLKNGSAHTARFGVKEAENLYASGERGPRVVLVSPTVMNQMLSIILDRPYESAPAAAGAAPAGR